MTTPPQQPHGPQQPHERQQSYGSRQPYYGGQPSHPGYGQLPPDRQPEGPLPQSPPPQGPQSPSSAYGPAPQNPSHAYGPTRPRNGLGTAALVLGIIAAVFAFIPLFGIFLAIPLAVLAVIFGVVGIVRASKRAATNKGVAISGTSLGCFAFVLTIVMTAAVFEAATSTRPSTDPVSASGQQGSGSGLGSETGSRTDDRGAADGQAATAAGVGDTVRSGDIALTVTKVRTKQQVSADFGYTEKARGRYVIVHVRVKNTGNDTYSFFAGSIYAYDEQGREYSSTADVAFVLGDTSLMEPINPGQTAQGYIAYDVPEKVTLSHIEVSGGFLAAPVTVRLT